MNWHGKSQFFVERSCVASVGFSACPDEQRIINYILSSRTRRAPATAKGVLVAVGMGWSWERRKEGMAELQHRSVQRERDGGGQVRRGGWPGALATRATLALLEPGSVTGAARRRLVRLVRKPASCGGRVVRGWGDEVV